MMNPYRLVCVSKLLFFNVFSMGEIWNQPTIVSVSYLNPIHSKSVLWLLTKCLVINWDPTWSNTTGCCCHSHYWFCLGLNRRFWDPSHCTVLCRVCSNHHPAVLHENRVKTVLTCGAFVSCHRVTGTGQNNCDWKQDLCIPEPIRRFFRSRSSRSGENRPVTWVRQNRVESMEATPQGALWNQT